MNKTKQRDLILFTVQNSKSHPTADEIFRAVRQQIPNISLGTVYRNLSLLADIGQIRKIAVPGQADRFDHNRDWHDHMICVECGRVMDVTLEIPLQEQIERKSGMRVFSYSLVAHCLCPDCASKQIEEGA